MKIEYLLSKRILCLYLLVFALFRVEPNVAAGSEPTINAFPDVLNIQGVPSQPGDLSVSCFSDLGAWHGYALPGRSQTSFFGGFIGPFLIAQNRWLSRCLTKLTLYNIENDRIIDLSQCQNPKFTFFPGLLTQEFQVDGISIQIDLYFISSRSALIRTNILNISSKPIRLRIGWQGNIFLKQAFLIHNAEGIVINLEKGESTVRLTLPPEMVVKTTLSDGGKAYYIEAKRTLQLSPGRSYKSYLIQTVCFDSTEIATEEQIINKVFKNPEECFSANGNRWNGYLKVLLSTAKGWASEDAYQTIAVKCLETLIINWRSPGGDLIHAGLYPSYQRFHGFWAWDSWKHAVALSLFEPELAKDQIRAMFDYQDKRGMVPDVIRLDKRYNNLRNTKPPLAAWAVWLVYKQTNDKAFLQEMYPKLLRYHRFWYTYRDHDRNGLCEYGSTDGTLVAAAWESGMDNAVRFDNAVMLQNGAHSWSVNRESVDLNSYLYAEKKYLTLMADALDNESDVITFNQESETLKLMIQKYMFDQKSDYFYDILLDGKGFCRIQGPEGWIPLWAGVATPEQAGQVKQVMLDPTKFATYIPFPTMAKVHPEFIPTYDGYWRGPVWLDQAYFAIKGLEHYGYMEDANRFIRQLFDRLEGLKQSGEPIYENYNPLNGKGLNARHFSWSAAHLLLLYHGQCHSGANHD
ncbi:glycoside hydrolase [candidate division WOR-3 bacterium]|nr:glycoside hydrolase [candidate division WOR-3 bacterium]